MENGTKPMNKENTDIKRFLRAQEVVYETALAATLTSIVSKTVKRLRSSSPTQVIYLSSRS